MGFEGDVFGGDDFEDDEFTDGGFKDTVSRMMGSRFCRWRTRG